jgi:hypothetical protein
MLPYKITPPGYRCLSYLCYFWHHYLNPFGNWLEPFPYPAKRMEQAQASWLPAPVWWALRNPLHNFMHHWIGIVPVKEHGYWYMPTQNGWERKHVGEPAGLFVSYWKKGWIRLPYVSFYSETVEGCFGWTSRGNFGLALRKAQSR